MSESNTLKLTPKAAAPTPATPAAPATVVVGCSLLNGLILSIDTPKGRVSKDFAGSNRAVAPAKYGATTVSAEFYSAFVEANPNFGPLKLCLLFIVPPAAPVAPATPVTPTPVTPASVTPATPTPAAPSTPA